MNGVVTGREKKRERARELDQDMEHLWLASNEADHDKEVLCTDCVLMQLIQQGFLQHISSDPLQLRSNHLGASCQQ